MDEALLLKKAVEQENKVLHDRLAECQRTLGTAYQAQALNAKHVSDLDDCLHNSTYQTKAAILLRQSFLEQLAALLSDGFTRVPATEEAIKNKVKEICSNDRTHVARAVEAGPFRIFKDETDRFSMSKGIEGYGERQENVVEDYHISHDLIGCRLTLSSSFPAANCKVFLSQNELAVQSCLALSLYPPFPKVKEMEEQVTNVNKQLEHQSDIYHQVLGRAQRAEEKLTQREEMLRHLQGQLAAEDLLKDACQFNQQK
eukprot:g39064.t1